MRIRRNSNREQLYIVMKILGEVLTVGVLGAIYGIISYVRGRRKLIEMSRHSYSEIASSWATWDDVVNCYHIDDKGNRVKPNTPMKSVFMDYDTFYQHSKEDKVRMLTADFGPERK